MRFKDMWNPIAVRLFGAAALLLAACSGGAAQPNRPPAAGAPVETRAAETPTQAPAFQGQTRAPGQALGVRYRVETVAQGLNHPWGLAFLPDGRLLVSERPGHLRFISRTGALSEPLSGVPRVRAAGQGGLLDVLLAPDFRASRMVYLSFFEAREAGGAITVIRARLSDTGLDGVTTIYQAQPGACGGINLGGRMAWGRDGKLYLTIGDCMRIRDQAQQLDSDIGKILRLNPDGSFPADNPFAGRAGARGGIWSMGHRNPQSLAFDASGQLWSVEHGARGGDELNRIRAGVNYGWPVITYGEEYSGEPVGEGITARAGLEQPVYYWDPVIAPSGMAFYDGAMFPAWRGSLFVGALRGQHLARLSLQDGRVVGEERLLTEVGERIRDVRVGPEGALYVLTDADNGRVLRLVAE